MDVPATIVAFSRQLSAFENIIGMVLYADVFPALGEPFVLDHGFQYAMSKDLTGAGYYTLFIENPSFALEVSGEVKEALKKAII